MLSYLQDKRPKRRGSTNLLNSFVRPSTGQPNAQEDKQRSPIAPVTSHSHHGYRKEESPKSTTSPRLPSIARITSQRETPGSNQRSENQMHWSFKGDGPQSTSGPAPPLSRPTIVTSNTFSSFLQPSSFQTSQSRGPLSSSSTPHKRPIDIRFEQMRSYSAMPFHQSVYDQGVPPNMIAQPHNPPTPPPKSAPLPPHLSQEREQDISSNQTLPTLAKTNNRSSNWNSRFLNKSQRQPSVQAACPANTPPQDAPTVYHRQSKPKMNLKNPMSLLARRRSYKPAEKTFAGTQNAPAPKLPDDYDPRIRGKVVHDFNAPRSSRPQTSRQEHESAQKDKRESIRLVGREDSPHSQERQHTPLFKEHFDDGLEKSQDPATRSEGFMRAAAAQASQPQPDPSQLPKFARKLPLKVSTDLETRENPVSQLANKPLEILIEPPDKHQSLAPSSPPNSPPRAASVATSVSDKAPSGINSPQRYKSTSSRFSFDLAGVGSAAQEKLLEDKHREKAQQKQRQSVLSGQSEYDEEDQSVDFDLDNTDDAGIEERIPGVNCDDDDDDDDAVFENNSMPVLRREMESFQLVSPNKSSFESTNSPVSTGVTSVDTPFLGMPWASSLASKSSPNLTLLPTGDTQLSTETIKEIRPRSTPGDSPVESTQAFPLHHRPSVDSELASFLQGRESIDDDMYFDDGMIDELGEVSDIYEFDENVFDDTSHGLYGLPLRDRTLKSLEPHENVVDVDPQKPTVAPQTSLTRDTDDSHISVHRSLSSGGVSAELRDALTELGHPNSSMFSQTAGLTQSNLAAYNQNTLVSAVNQAAVNGVFDRTPSLQSQQAPHVPSPESSISEAVDHYPNKMTGAKIQSLEDTIDSDSDGLDDDDIVAAANAEALENDDDGFYGQEFGFYARASNKESGAEYVNGGYFGARGLDDGIHRSHSGKGMFEEPSLTPITERSEWSNRNSTISLAQLHGYSFPMPSPGFDMPHDDVNMQLAMLKQLRRGAWGGSDASLHSSSGSQQSGSSMNHFPPPGGIVFPSPLQANNSTSNLQNLSPSFQSYNSSGRPSSNDSGNSPDPDSPTITLPIQQPTSTITSPPATAHSATWSMPPPLIPASAMHNLPLQSPSPRAPVRSSLSKGHSRNSSGAESVSYTEEGGKWEMEKRRMSETGELTMVGRSVLEAGMI